MYAQNVAKQVKRNRPDTARSYLNDPMSTDADASFQPRHLGRYHDDMQQGGLADHQQHPQPHTSYLPLSRFSSSQTPHDSGGYPHSMPPPPAQYPNYPAIPGPSRVGAGSSSSAHYNPSSSSSSSRAPVQQQQSSQMRFDVETGHDSTFNDASESTSRIPDKTSRSSRSHDTGPHSHATLTRSSGKMTTGTANDHNGGLWERSCSRLRSTLQANRTSTYSGPRQTPLVMPD